MYRLSQRGQTEVDASSERDSEYISRRILRLELAGSRPRGRGERSFMDVVKEALK